MCCTFQLIWVGYYFQQIEEQVTEVKRGIIITNNNLLYDLIQATIMTSSSAFLKNYNLSLRARSSL